MAIHHPKVDQSVLVSTMQYLECLEPKVVILLNFLLKCKAGIAKSRRSEPKNFNAGAPGSDTKFDFKAFSKTGFLSECKSDNCILPKTTSTKIPTKLSINTETLTGVKLKKTIRVHLNLLEVLLSCNPLPKFLIPRKKNIEYISDPISARPQTASNADSQKNFFTNPAKKGFGGNVGITLGKFFEYLPDPYERKKEHATV
jgi:Domain of unknown function (DUF4586)